MSPHRRRLTRHHLYPTSRGVWRGKNTADIDEVLHYAWHAAFDDLTPEEIIQDFLDIWWPDEGYTVMAVVGTVERTYARRAQRLPRTTRAPSGFEIIFPNPRPLEILKIWLWRWVPDDYFELVTFQAPGLTHVMDAYTVDHQLLNRHTAEQQRLLNEAYRRWASVGHWWKNGAYDQFLTRV